MHYNSNGLPNLLNSKDGSFIHSKHDPYKEGMRFAETNLQEFFAYPKKPTILICFGFGMGYHIESILKLSGGNIRVACVEPEKQVLAIPEVKKKALS